MDQAVVVKTEMQSNGDILLFYVDENGGNEEGVLTTVENIENQAIELQQDYILPDVSELNNISIPQSSTQNETWNEDDIKRLLIFYNDNKQTFITGTTKKKHLWTVACKTMLLGKNPNSCETQLNTLQTKYIEVYNHIQKGVYVKWPYFDLCHQVFHDESNSTTEEYEITIQPQVVDIQPEKSNYDNLLVMKKPTSRTSADEKVEQMLSLYLKYKKNFQQEYRRKDLWESIAMELGEDDGEYWQKRFLNYKQHYLRLLDKKQAEGPESINWPYMESFNKIFEGDKDFNRKYGTQDVKATETAAVTDLLVPQNDWNNTEMTVLVKYCYDCFDEFEDKTIPNNFLWNEIGRLLDKDADTCKAKYEEMKNAHLDKYIEGGYDLRNRKPVAILFDNIISKEIESQIVKMRNKPEQLELWKTEDIDELVQFFYENIEMYKDVICHYVCWAAIVKKLKRNLQSCRGQWEDLMALYKTILNDKKENPDMQIDWRYIELFDRIFDYGMDTKLLSGYDKVKAQDTGKIGVKKIKIKAEHPPADDSDDDESFDERGFTKRTKRHAGESKAFKILEYYQKNKDKFSTTNRNKHSLWDILARQIGISATQCAHRFRNLKQVYTSYVQREINKPEMPILWPYYTLCKKVFGYRAIKTKLKNGKIDSDDSEDWSAKEIKLIINYFAQNFDEINNNADDSSKWLDLAGEIGKGEMSCKDKFLELRKSYRKLKTMKSRNPEVKISWKYFAMFEQIYSTKEDGQDMDVDQSFIPMDIVKGEQLEEDDYQCIIVMPEGEDISNMENAQIIIQEHGTIPQELLDGQTVQETTLQEIALHENALQEIALHENALQEIALQENALQEISLHETALQEALQHTEVLETIVQETASPDLGMQETALQENVIVKAVKWTIRMKKLLLIYYINYIRSHKGKEINAKEMWTEIASKLNLKAITCKKMFAKLKAKRSEFVDDSIKKPVYYGLVEKVTRLNPKFAKSTQNNTPRGERKYKDVVLPDEKVAKALHYYLDNIEDFVSPRFERKYLWTELANHVGEPVTKVFNKVNYLKQYYNIDTDEVAGQKTYFAPLLKEIFAKEIAIKLVIENEPKPVIEDLGIEEFWSDDETEKLLEWYLSNLEKFKNPKFVRSYLWMEISTILNKSAIACSRKMSEIRTQYRTMVRESPNELLEWRFLDLCQKIYGTGKKGSQVVSSQPDA